MAPKIFPRLEPPLPTSPPDIWHHGCVLHLYRFDCILECHINGIIQVQPFWVWLRSLCIMLLGIIPVVVEWNSAVGLCHGLFIHSPDEGLLVSQTQFSTIEIWMWRTSLTWVIHAERSFFSRACRYLPKQNMSGLSGTYGRRQHVEISQSLSSACCIIKLDPITGE